MGIVLVVHAAGVVMGEHFGLWRPHLGYASAQEAGDLDRTDSRARAVRTVGGRNTKGAKGPDVGWDAETSR